MRCDAIKSLPLVKLVRVPRISVTHGVMELDLMLRFVQFGTTATPLQYKYYGMQCTVRAAIQIIDENVQEVQPAFSSGAS